MRTLSLIACITFVGYILRRQGWIVAKYEDVTLDH